MTRINDQRGVAMVLELVLVALVIAVAGFAVYSSVHKKASSVVARNTPGPSTSSTPTPNPYAGWYSYTLKYEKISFKYPSDWTLKDQSRPSDTDSKGQPIYTPGSDGVTLASKSGLTINISTAMSSWDGGGPPTVLQSTPINMLGTTYYLNFISITANNNPPENAGFYLVKSAADPASPSNFPETKNITLGPGASNPALQDIPKPYDLINVYLVDHQPLNNYLSDPDYATALKILESMTY